MGLNNLSKEEQFATILGHHYRHEDFPELAPIAVELGIDISRLINMYTSLSLSGNVKLPTAALRLMFSYIEENLIQLQSLASISWWVFVEQRWSLDHETASHGMRVLQFLVGKLLQQPDVFQDTIFLFFLLLSFDTAPLRLAPTILSCMTDKLFQTDFSVLHWLADATSNIPLEHLIALMSFTRHEDIRVQQGAISLWAEIIEAILTRKPLFTRQQSKFNGLEFDWKLCFNLIKDTHGSLK